MAGNANPVAEALTYLRDWIGVSLRQTGVVERIYRESERQEGDIVMTLEDLIAAYESGELSAPLWIDNDTTYVYKITSHDPYRDEQVFRMHPQELLEALLDHVGIPHEHVSDELTRASDAEGGGPAADDGRVPGE